MPVVKTTGSTDSATALLPDELMNQKRPGRIGVARQFTWKEVKQLIAANRLELLGRTTPEELAYREEMELVREKHGSVVNYIVSVKLAGFIADATEEYLLIPNDYPYALPEDTLHYIVWSKTDLSPGTVPDPPVEGIFTEALDNQIGKGKYEWVWFVNPPHLQSIPDVVHGHLIVRKL
ncbi:hypothetical protein GGF46_002260 [Coemansia sp. RSA 552]|nr:hypothetical protein GGF46_002260 [Coemansia sp. RSA 552]